jgi:uridine kinase
MIKPKIIGLAGKTCSGKSTICKILSEKNKNILWIKADLFFKKETFSTMCPSTEC